MFIITELLLSISLLIYICKWLNIKDYKTLINMMSKAEVEQQVKAKPLPPPVFAKPKKMKKVVKKKDEYTIIHEGLDKLRNNK